MSKINQIKAGIVFSYGSLVIANVISILYTPIMIRLLGQSEYGLYNLSSSIVGYLGVLDFGIGSAVIRYTAKYKELKNEEKEYNLYGMFFVIYSIMAVIVLVVGIGLLFNTSTFFSQSLTKNEINRISVMMWLMILNLAISFPFGIFGSIIIAHEHFIFSKLISIVRMILNPFIMLPLLLMGFGSVGLTFATTILNILFICFNMIYCFNKLKIKLKFNQMEFPLLKEIGVYSIFIFLNIIVDKIYWSTDQFILGSVCGSIAVAVYSIGSCFNGYYMNFSTAISGVFLPKVTRMVTQNISDNELSDLFIKTGRLQFIILAYILGGFLLVGKRFILLWAGEGYEESFMIALIVMLPLTIPLLQTIGITILQAKNMHQFRSIIYIIIAIINVLASIPLARVLGGVGCALATAGSMIIGHGLIMNVYYYKKLRIDIPNFWLQISKMCLPVLASLGLTMITGKFIDVECFLSMLIDGMIFTAYYFCLMWWFVLNESEKNLFINPIRCILCKLNYS